VSIGNSEKLGVKVEQGTEKATAKMQRIQANLLLCAKGIYSYFIGPCIPNQLHLFAPTSTFAAV
jgi:hypothetical protein